MRPVQNLLSMIKGIELAHEAESRAREEAREKLGLPSWDMFLTATQWKSVKEEGIKHGFLIRHGDHYRVQGLGYPPARIMIVGRIGEELINPAAEEDALQADGLWKNVTAIELGCPRCDYVPSSVSDLVTHQNTAHPKGLKS